MNFVEHALLHHVKHARDIGQHLHYLRRLASTCSHITEFGMAQGASTTAFIAARPKKLITYDIGDWPTNQLYILARHAGVELRCVKENTLETTIEETDLLFIDSTHTYAHLSVELARHSPMARRFIVLHDTVKCWKTGMHSSHADYPGIDFARVGGRVKVEGIGRAILEFLSKGEWVVKEKFKRNNGLMVLARKE